MKDFYSLQNIENLPPKEEKMVQDLITVWELKRGKNQKRIDYYLGHNDLKNLGISIPPEMENKLNENIGWAQKAVNALANRSKFDGVVFESGQNEDLDNCLIENNFKNLYEQAVRSQLINSCSFLTVSRGSEGEPKALINAYSALTASAMWDTRRKRIKCGITIVECDEDPRHELDEPIWVNLYTDTHVWEIKRADTSSPWIATPYEHKMGRPLIEPMVYQQELLRPFGRSRISRAVMSIVDNAIRTLARAELSAEFFSRPQRYLLGADEDTFNDQSKWEAYTGVIFAVSKDGDGETPQYGQLNAQSMQPHLDQLRSLAAQFAGETNVPIAELGVIHDNPSSAQAIYASKEPLIIEAENLNQSNGEALKNIMRMVLAILQDKALSELDPSDTRLQPLFRNPARASMAEETDSAQKQCSFMEWFKYSDVCLEKLGYNDGERVRMRADRDKYQVKQAILQQMAEGATGNDSIETADNSGGERSGQPNSVNEEINSSGVREPENQ
jgi:hypothetical protein